jgi:peptide/nickel transport system substrate-binding protein
LKRAAMRAEMQQILHDDGGLVNILFNSCVEAHVKNLSHGNVAANWQLDGMRVAERWWYTA